MFGIIVAFSGKFQFPVSRYRPEVENMRMHSFRVNSYTPKVSSHLSSVYWCPRSWVTHLKWTPSKVLESTSNQINCVLTKIFLLLCPFAFDFVVEVFVTSNSNLFQRSANFDSQFLPNIHKGWAPSLFKIVSGTAIPIWSTMIIPDVDWNPFQAFFGSVEKFFGFPLTISDLDKRYYTFSGYL